MKFALSLMNFESNGYFLFWIGVVIYSGFKVKNAGEALAEEHEYGDFSVGWKILNGKKKDTSDYDWMIIKYLFYHQFQWISLHLIITEILRWKNYEKLIPVAQTAITLTYLAFNYSLTIFYLVLFQPVIFEICSKFKQKLIIWMCEIFCLILLHNYKSFPVYLSTYEEHVTIILTVYWMNLRCVSYYISKVDSTKTYNFIHALSYLLYLPLFSNGPFVDFNQFAKREEPIKTTFHERIRKLCVNLLRFIFWMVFTEFLLHYIYASAIAFYPQDVEKFDNWTLYGYGYCMGQYFHLKYVVLYGISTTLAKFENIPAPNAPKCIGRIHLYSDMWRYFDSGLYTFLKRYIYVPLLKRKFLPFLASFVCFSFVFVWHGLTQDILIWAFLNFVCVTIEGTFRIFYKTYCKKECDAIFDETWKQRLSCILAAPLLAISAISNFYFFAGSEIGNLYFARFFLGGYQMMCILLFSLYCCCQASSYVKKKEMIQSNKFQTSGDGQ